MSAAKHTPGPWTMQTMRTDCGVCFKVGPFPWKRGEINHACIYADYPGNGPEYAQLVANATLIAAAPDLFTELHDILRSIKGGGNVVTFNDVDVARYEALIAKATGAAA